MSIYDTLGPEAIAILDMIEREATLCPLCWEEQHKEGCNLLAVLRKAGRR